LREIAGAFGVKPKAVAKSNVMAVPAPEGEVRKAS
jgi:hypothetical protein